MDAAEGDFLPDDHDDPAVGGSALNLHGSGCGSRAWSGGSGTPQPGHLGRGERVRSGAQQLPGVEVEEAQRLVLDADADAPAAEDFGGQDDVLPEGDVPAAADGPVDLDRLTWWRRRQRWFTSWPAALCEQASEVGCGQV
ncbi:hypothetical protein ACSNN7_00980 [Micromonospora sp. URMC 105]|uniref:hypothetical protein n=1 Tax=Micromonospora sp. URMC 105 TaxID=3423413 RepID=UPI003F1B9C7F